MVLVSTNHDVSHASTLFVKAYDFDFASKDELLGTLQLGLLDLLRMSEQENYKVLRVDQPLQRNGQSCGRISFKLEISKFIG